MREVSRQLQGTVNLANKNREIRKLVVRDICAGWQASISKISELTSKSLKVDQTLFI